MPLYFCCMHCSVHARTKWGGGVEAVVVHALAATKRGFVHKNFYKRYQNNAEKQLQRLKPSPGQEECDLTPVCE